MTNSGLIFHLRRYYVRDDAEACFKWVNGTRLDDRTIRVDWDIGFKESRQYGRGKSGGQVRDEYRTDYDPGRGGYGKQSQREVRSRVATSSSPLCGLSRESSSLTVRLAIMQTRQLQTPFLHATTAYDPNSLPSLPEPSPALYKAREERFASGTVARMMPLLDLACQLIASALQSVRPERSEGGQKTKKKNPVDRWPRYHLLRQ